MRITILTVGSRGDVQPYVALGLGLKQAGHQVCLATHDTFRELVNGRDLDLFPVVGNPRELLEGELGQTWLGSGQNPFHFSRRFIRLVEPFLERLLTDSWQACQGAEVIIFSLLGLPGYHIAERLGVPCFAAWLQPISRTRTFPSLLAPNGLRLGGAYNLLTHFLLEQLLWQPFRRQTNRWRQEILNLAPLSFLGPRTLHQQQPTLYGYSPMVVPKPSDWPGWLHITGYWFLDRPEDWHPPTGLVDFLDSGPPPVYIGFGSMTDRDPEALTDLTLQALAHCKQRGILLTGWAGLSHADLPDEVFKLGAVPHDWLFPKMAAVVHHGGAGTTAAGLRAGVPTIIVSYIPDQYFWGQRLAALGVGPAPIPRQKLTVERLTAAIQTAVTDPAMPKLAAEIGQRIRAEDGVAKAVEAMEHYL